MFEGRCKLAVCWPWSIDEVKSRFAETALNLKHPENCEVRWIRGRGWCASRRHNHCLEQALSWGADLILIVGADQVYPDTEMLCKLVNHWRGGCPVVTTLVPMRGMIASQKGGPFQAVAWRLKQEAVDAGITSDTLNYDHFEVISREKHGDLVQIHAGGSGVLLFPAAALSKMAMPWFTEKPKYPTFEREQCCDLPFLIRLQAEAGLSIWCDTTTDVRHLHTFEIDHTFTERFADWEQGGGDPSICAYGTSNVPEVPRETKILQARVSPSIPLYDKRFRKRYGLRPYHNTFQPAFFFGCYTDADVFAIHQHNGPAVIIWAGSDAERFRQLHKTGAYNGIFKPNVYHIAISKFIEDDLKAVGLAFKSLPLCCVDESMFKPTPREGRKGIYVYCPDGSREKYGGKLLDEIMALLPNEKFVIQTRLDPLADMPAIYEKCGIGLRLTKHDGLSNTVIELGLMGRMVLWNGRSPNAIPYSGAKDAANKIREELYGSALSN